MKAKVVGWCDIDCLSYTARISGPTPMLRAVQSIHSASVAQRTGGVSSNDVVNFSVEPMDPVSGSFSVRQDAESAWKASSAGDALAHLVWKITTTTVERLRQTHLLFHGAGVALGERGLIMPAASGSGKSTLTAGLVGSGFRYYSDDVVVLDLASQRLLPFPKSISIKNGSEGLLAIRYPELLRGYVPRVRTLAESVVFVSPPKLAAAERGVRVHYVVLPRYVPGAPTLLNPISRSETVRHFFEQSFSLRTHGAQGMAALTALLNGADCYSLTVGDLGNAVSCLRDLAEMDEMSHWRQPGQVG